MNAINISFLGDISLNDNYITLYKNGVDPFSGIRLILHQSDYVIGNLESMAKGDEGENKLKRPRLTTTVETLNYLKNINLSIACLAQNHVYDQMKDGFVKTVDFLGKNNINYLGAGFSDEEAVQEKIIDKNGIKIGILNYVTSDTNPSLPKGASVCLNLFDKGKAIEDIQRIKPHVNHVVLQLHWGGKVEGGLFPDFYQRKLAKSLVENGADLIIGHHSHTLQPFEIYKNKYIFYSLGNFCFSDISGSEGIIQFGLTRYKKSIILEVSFKPDTYDVSFKPIINNDGYIEMESQKYPNLFMKIIFSLIYKNKIVWNLYYFFFKYTFPLLTFITAKDTSIRNLSLKKIVRYIKK